MNFRLVFTLTLTSLLSVVSISAQQFRVPSDSHERLHAHHDVGHTGVRHFIEHTGPAIVGEQPSDDPCRDGGWDDEYFRACDVREYTLPAGPLTVDAGRNGGIRVEGWDRNEIRVQAVVTANARREDDAKQLASAVQVQAGSGKVTSSGPSTQGREWWSVSYRINVPRRNDLELSANNGGITINSVSGTIRFETTNGGVRLSDLAGDVRGETRNGGLNVALAGDRWDGAGLDVQTANGGVTLEIPDGYNADLTTRTVNGGFRSDYPLTIQGELSPRRGISTTLGSGGPPVSVRTTNGGLRINRR
jgi:DUF4097 and DUF4098 domain-containing protein YvlB